VARILIPAPYRRYTGNESEYRCSGDTVGTVMRALVRDYPEMKPRLFDDRGNVRKYVHVFIGDRDIRATGALDTPVHEETVIKLVPAIAGG
jgi:molybdopterin converting factor small subunit